METQACRIRGRCFATLTLLGAVLAGCGGGGGDDGGGLLPPPGDVDLTSTNRDSASRATAVAVQGSLVVGDIGLTGGGSGGMAAAIVAQVGGRKAATALIGRKTPDALFDVSFLFPCASGTAVGTLDDRDNSQTVTPGDVLTASFSNCLIDAASGETIDGALTATYTTAVQSPLTVGANVSVSNLRGASAQAGRSATLNGGFTLSYVEPTSSTSTTQITVPSAMTIQAVHPLYQDTIGLQPGYRITTYYDLATPPGAPGGGRTIIEVLGKLSSVNTGGIFNVWSQPPGLDQWDVDAYPRSGQVLLQGRNGNVTMTVLSNTTVRVELDANGDGTNESSQDVAWDTLL